MLTPKSETLLSAFIYDPSPPKIIKIGKSMDSRLRAESGCFYSADWVNYLSRSWPSFIESESKMLWTEVVMVVTSSIIKVTRP